MSVTVAIEDLAEQLVERPWGYLLTVGPDLRTHLVAVPADLRDGRFHVSAGRSTTANAAERPEVTMVFPPASGEGYSLVVDGIAHVHDDRVEVEPSAAVLHRPALSPRR